MIALADAKGLEFDHVYVLGLERSDAAERAPGPAAVPPELLGEPPRARRARRGDGAPAPGPCTSR